MKLMQKIKCKKSNYHKFIGLKTVVTLFTTFVFKINMILNVTAIIVQTEIEKWFD